MTLKELELKKLESFEKIFTFNKDVVFTSNGRRLKIVDYNIVKINNKNCIKVSKDEYSSEENNEFFVSIDLLFTKAYNLCQSSGESFSEIVLDSIKTILNKHGIESSYFLTSDVYSCAAYSIIDSSVTVFNNKKYSIDQEKRTIKEGSKYRIEIKVGKLLQDCLFFDFESPIPYKPLLKMPNNFNKNKIIEDIVVEIKNTIKNMNDLFEYEIVSGEDIRKYYLEDYYSHEDECSTLLNSCMRYKDCQSFFDIYVENAEMLIIRHKNDLTNIFGRSLIWKDIYGQKLYDRIYSNSYGSFFMEKLFNDLKIKYVKDKNTIVKIKKFYNEIPYMDSLDKEYSKDGEVYLTNIDIDENPNLLKEYKGEREYLRSTCGNSWFVCNACGEMHYNGNNTTDGKICENCFDDMHYNWNSELNMYERNGDYDENNYEDDDF